MNMQWKAAKNISEKKNYKNYFCWHKTLQAHWIIWKIYRAVKEMIKQYWMLKKINVKLTKRNFFMDWANEIRFSNQRWGRSKTRKEIIFLCDDRWETSNQASFPKMNFYFFFLKEFWFTFRLADRVWIFRLWGF